MITDTLKSLAVTNMGPFADTVQLFTTADESKKELLQENTYKINDQRFNKVSYIFGANGAGKSNFCKAILQMQNILLLSPILNLNNPQLAEITFLKNNSIDAQNQFKFSRQYINKPTNFCIELLLKGITYTYSFAIFEKNIISEKLTKKYRRTETIINRTSPNYNDISLRSELLSFKNNLHVVKDNALCLSMAAFLNNKLATELVNAITQIKVVNMAAMRRFQHITEDTCSKERLSKYLKILQSADPTLKDINVSFAEKKVERQRINAPDLEDREFTIRSVEVDVESTHNIYDGNKVVDFTTLPFLEIESNGTIKLFNALPVIFDALENGGVVIIDEIENGLHPFIVKQLTELFYNPEINPHNAQLICTTHSTMLIDKGVRRDQIWILSKDTFGKSSIYRISDVPGIRAYENNGRKYLDNAFGEIPDCIFKE